MVSGLAIIKTSLQAYLDGNNLHLVIKNPSPELGKDINDLLLKYCGFSEFKEVKGLVPELPEDMADIPIPDKEFEIPMEKWSERPLNEPLSKEQILNIRIHNMNITLGQAIEHKDTQAVIHALINASVYSEKEKTGLIKMCKSYIFKDCKNRNPDITPTEEIAKFCCLYKPLIQDALKEILDRVGYETIEDFLDTSFEYLHQDAYAAILEMMLRDLS